MPNRKPIRRLMIIAQIVLTACVAHTFAAARLSGIEYAGIYDIRELAPELTGEGISLASICRSETYVEGEPQNDYLFNIEHNCFINRDIEFSEGLSIANGISDHATKIGGILAGLDPNGFCEEIGNFNYEGVAYDAQISVHEFWRFVSTIIYGKERFQADILTMSVGSIFERWWTRGIENYIDETGLVVVAGIGNGSDVYDPALYPGAGSNVIGVGVVDSVLVDGEIKYGLPTAKHSSMGPTNDGRCGPDILAPGNMAVPDANSTGGYSLSGDWSSFATPVVSGTVGLLMQKAKSNEDLADAANNLVMRAIILNSARKLPYWHKGKITTEDDHDYPLDFLQGAGVVDAAGAYKHLVAGRGGANIDGTIGWDENAIPRVSGSENIYKISVDDDIKGKYITATVVWNKHYQNEYPFDANEAADTDLSLEVWGIDGNNKHNLIDYSNSKNDNIEHVYLPADPNYVSFDLIVKVEDAGDGGNAYESYGFAWSVEQRDNRDDDFKYDLNLDGKIDSGDLDELLIKVTDPSVNHHGDFNLNGEIDIDDITELLTVLIDNKVNLAVINE